jgi:preprotein translocase subunit SecD
MGKAKQIFTNWRVIALIAFLALSIIAINPHLGNEGVAIRQVEKNSSAEKAGIQSPVPTATPTARERVLAINNQPVVTVEDYYSTLAGYPANRTVSITTSKSTYQLTTQPNYIVTPGPNGSTTTVNGTKDLGLVVYGAPKSNIRLGLDLSGGTRVILRPKEQVSQDDLNLIIDNIKQRLNVFGLSDITVRSAKDLNGEDFIIVEIAGANQQEVESLLSQQGKFEAKIGNATVFRGGQDITYVCRSADCSGLDRNYGCGQAPGGYVCRFSFEISLSPQAAERQANLTRNLAIKGDQGGQYLSEPLTLYLDNEQVDQLQISSDLRGKAATSILISGSGAGTSQQAAAQDAIENMKKLQTVLVTGSLPVQLEIVKSDGISPVLGSEFISNAYLIGLLSIIAVTLVLIVRYRKAIIAFPIIITMLSEVTIILGFAAWVGWNLDLAGIAAIIIAIGSGVDDQIVIIDETIHGGVSHKTTGRSWKERIGTAFFIIFASYFTLVAAMIPLWFAGAGLLRGFAITTIVGVTAGVLVTRPAFAAVTEILLKKEEEE